MTRFSVVLQTSPFTMRFTLETVIAALPLFITAAPRHAKQRGAAVPLSKLSSPVNADKSVNFEALNSHIAATTAKILHGFGNFEKNTGASHPSAMKGAWKRDPSGLPLISLDDPLDRFFGTISIGTPPRNFAVLFDTGSSDVILPGPECDNTCDGHGIYDPEASSTSADLGKPFSINFTGGASSFGNQYTDNVTIVGLTATDQTLGAAAHYSEALQSWQFAGDGLLGMASQSISSFDQSPFFQTLVRQDQTVEPVFAFSLAYTAPELYLGGTNPDLYTGDFTWAPVTQQGHWLVNIDSVVGNEQHVLTNVPGIIDTGSVLICGFPEDVTIFYAAVGGIPVPSEPGFYSFPCDAVPSVSLTFGGRSFPIPAETFNIGFHSGDSSQCIGSIFAGNVAETWIVGTAFLESVYIAFDVAEMRVGFATLNDASGLA
ncbi:acid protease [Gyrodon lividus]|nr:acid protease [Gyrodon lividus]